MCAIESEMRRYSDGSRNAMLGVKGIWEAHGPLRENSRGKLQNVVRNSSGEENDIRSNDSTISQMNGQKLLPGAP